MRGAGGGRREASRSVVKCPALCLGKELVNMLKLRLRRMGARNRPSYRVVVSDSRLTARAKVLEELGSYDPVAGAGSFLVDRERAQYWIGKGAAVSSTVRSLLEKPQPAAPAQASPAPAASAPAAS